LEPALAAELDEYRQQLLEASRDTVEEKIQKIVREAVVEQGLPCGLVELPAPEESPGGPGQPGGGIGDRPSGTRRAKVFRFLNQIRAGRKQGHARYRHSHVPATLMVPDFSRNGNGPRNLPER